MQTIGDYKTFDVLSKKSICYVIHSFFVDSGYIFFFLKLNIVIYPSKAWLQICVYVLMYAYTNIYTNFYIKCIIILCMYISVCVNMCALANVLQYPNMHGMQIFLVCLSLNIFNYTSFFEIICIITIFGSTKLSIVNFHFGVDLYYPQY